MIAVDKFNRLSTEEWKAAKILSGSSIASSCNYLYYKSIINKEELVFEFEYAQPGKREHFFKEDENKHNPNVKLCEKTLYLQFKGGDEIPPFLLRVTPDCMKQAPGFLYVEDYKTTTKKSWGYKYKYYKDGLPFGNKMQLSLQKYAIYIHHGIIAEKGVINFIMVSDDRTERMLNEMNVADDLFTFEEIEDFIFNHPAVTEDKSTLATAINEFKAHSDWLCGWKKCTECKDILNKPTKIINKPRKTRATLI